MSFKPLFKQPAVLLFIALLVLAVGNASAGVVDSVDSLDIAALENAETMIALEGRSLDERLIYPWRYAPTCCQKCSLLTACCCPAPIVVVKYTATMTKTMIAHKRQLQGTPRPSKSKQLQVALGRSSLENLQSLKRRSDLEKRSLCLLCPVGVKILGVLLHDKGLNSRLCCPPQKIYTKYAKKIVTATIRPNLVAKPSVVGRVFCDANGDCKYQTGETVVANRVFYVAKPIDTFTCPASLGEGTTDANGYLNIPIPSFPFGTKLWLVDKAKCDRPVYVFHIDKSGGKMDLAASLKVPAQLFYDAPYTINGQTITVNGHGGSSGNGVALYCSGIVIGTATISSNGYFTVVGTLPANSSCQLSIRQIGPQGCSSQPTLIGSTGKASVRGRVFCDANGDCKYQAGESLVANRVFYVAKPVTSFVCPASLGEGSTDANGYLDITIPPQPKGTELWLVDKARCDRPAYIFHTDSSGGKSDMFASIQAPAKLIYEPPYTLNGQIITVRGRGGTSGNTVAVYCGANVIGSSTISSSGTFSVSATIPSTGPSCQLTLVQIGSYGCNSQPVPFASANKALVQGRVFCDANGDCKFQDGEEVVPNHLFYVAKPVTSFVCPTSLGEGSTDANGFLNITIASQALGTELWLVDKAKCDRPVYVFHVDSSGGKRDLMASIPAPAKLIYDAPYTINGQTITVNGHGGSSGNGVALYCSGIVIGTATISSNGYFTVVGTLPATGSCQLSIRQIGPYGCNSPPEPVGPSPAGDATTTAMGITMRTKSTSATEEAVPTTTQEPATTEAPAPTEAPETTTEEPTTTETETTTSKSASTTQTWTKSATSTSLSKTTSKSSSTTSRSKTSSTTSRTATKSQTLTSTTETATTSTETETSTSETETSTSETETSTSETETSSSETETSSTSETQTSSTSLTITQTTRTSTSKTTSKSGTKTPSTTSLSRTTSKSSSTTSRTSSSKTQTRTSTSLSETTTSETETSTSETETSTSETETSTTETETSTSETTTSETQTSSTRTSSTSRTQTSTSKTSSTSKTQTTSSRTSSTSQTQTSTSKTLTTSETQTSTTQTKTSTTSATATPFAWINGTAAPNSYVDIYFRNGTFLDRIPTNENGFFSKPVPIWPFEPFYAFGGPGAIPYPVQFVTDANGNGYAEVPLEYFFMDTYKMSPGAPTGKLEGTANPNSWVSFYFPNGTGIKNTTTDSNGYIDPVTVPVFPNEDMLAYAPLPTSTLAKRNTDGLAKISNLPVPFTTDQMGNAWVVLAQPRGLAPDRKTSSKTASQSRTATRTTSKPIAPTSTTVPFLRYPAGMGSSGNDQTNAIVAAPNGDTLFAGSFSGPTFNLGVKGSSPFTVTNAAPGGGTTDAWLGKWLASSQSATWIARFGNAAGNEAVNDMVADSSSNIFFAGTFSTVNSQNQLYTQALVGRLSSTGATTWVVRFGNGGNNEAMGVTLSPAQDFIYVTGSYDTGITFGSTTYTSTGGSNVFVVKMSASTGAIQWGIQFSGTSMDRAYSIVTDLSSKVEQGSVLIAGYTTSPAFGAGSFRLNTNGGEEGWIARVSPTGTITWAAVVGGTGNDRPTMGLAVSSSTGNIYVSGSISSSSVLFGANTVTKAGAGSAISVAKFAPSGTPMWLKVFSGDGNDECSSLALNMASETIYVGATKGSSSLTFNGATVTSRLIVFSLDSNGNAITAGQITGASTSRTQNVVRTTYLDLQGRVWIGGSFDSADTVSLNGAPFAEFGAQDAFVGLFSSNLQPLVS